MPQVGICRLLIVLENFAEYKFVRIQCEGISEDTDWNQKHIAVGALRLGGTGAIEIPHGDVFQSMRFTVQGPGFRAKMFSRAIDPDIGRLYIAALGQVQVMLSQSLVQPGTGGHRHLGESERAVGGLGLRLALTFPLWQTGRQLHREPANHGGD